MNKKVFISHSKEDRNIAEFICNSLENESICCWIAPRDIPYGDDWAGKITEAISQSSLFLFLFSKNSNKSRQCPKEVNLADSANIPIICVAIDNTQMNSTLKYHLSLVQGVYLNTNNLSSYIDNIVTSVKLKLNESMNLSLSGNLDKQLEQNFNKLFGDSNEKDSMVQNDFCKILDKKISQYHISEFKKLNSAVSENSNNELQSSEVNLDEYDEYGDPKQTFFVDKKGKTYLKGKHFSITEDKNSNTIIYRVIKNYDISDFTIYYAVERLDRMTEDEGQVVKRTWFIDSPKLTEDLVILTFKKAENYVIVNSGISNTNKIKISHEPSIVHFENVKGSEKALEFEYSEDSIYIILDPETANELPRKTVVDAEGNKKVVVDLITRKSYFTFCIMDKLTNKNRIPMDYEDVGDFFMKGVKGFPKNTYNALVWYEKAKTKDAYKKMANIFMNDPVFKDETLAAKYTKLYLDIKI